MITSKGKFIIATPTKCGTTTLEELARRHAGGRISRGGVWDESFRIMDWEAPRRQHRMALPPDRGVSEGWGNVDRYVVVRNPYLRYLSIYMYLKEPRNFSQWGAREVQGCNWPGQSNYRLAHEPMCFETFLQWLVDKRAEYSSAGLMGKRRGAVYEGRAYRSPWVWLDPLPRSVWFLASQSGSQQGRVSLLRLENLEADLGEVLDGHDVALRRWDRLGLHIWANKTIGLQKLGAGDRGLAASQGWAWGGIRHGRKVFSADGTYAGPVERHDGCDCGACLIDAGAEAQFCGYIH